MSKRQRKIEEAKELLDYTGNPSEKVGAKAVKEVAKKELDDLEKKQNVEREILDKVRTKNKEYRKALLYLLHTGMTTVDWPKGYQWGVWFDGKGIIAAFIDTEKRKHIKAFVPSYVTKYDHNALLVLVRFCEDSIIKENSPVWTPKN